MFDRQLDLTFLNQNSSFPGLHFATLPPQTSLVYDSLFLLFLKSYCKNRDNRLVVMIKLHLYL